MSERRRLFRKLLPWIAILIVLSGLSYTPLWGGELTGWCKDGFCRLPSRPVVAVAAQLHPAVCRVTVATASGRLHGSGTLVAPGVVLTCGHIFCDGADSITVVIGGRSHAGKLLAVDPQFDLAAISLPGISASIMPIASQAARPGDAVTAQGFAGPARRPMSIAGRARGYVQRKGIPRAESLEISVGTIEGMSGGPMINSRGELVAVLWGSDGRTAEGTWCGRVQKFLDGLRQEVPAVVPSLQPWKPPTREPSDSPLLAMMKEQRILIAALQKKVASLEKLKLIPAGNGGERGPPGPAGPPGVVDYSDLPPITVQTVSGGKIIKSVKVFLGGEPLSLQLLPIDQNGGSK